MGKPYPRKYREFRDLFETTRRETQKPLYLVPYLMTGHPGCDLRDAVDLALFVKDLGHFAEQVQDFTPTPMTRSTCMFHTCRDPASGERVLVPRGREKGVHRALAQSQDPRNRAYLIRHFEAAGRRDILRRLYGGNYRGPSRPMRPSAGKPPRTGQRQRGKGAGRKGSAR
jgi:radical SAM superfamily enzyme YgiQ (UPF0313 family)